MRLCQHRSSPPFIPCPLLLTSPNDCRHPSTVCGAPPQVPYELLARLTGLLPAGAGGSLRAAPYLAVCVVCSTTRPTCRPPRSPSVHPSPAGSLRRRTWRTIDVGSTHPVPCSSELLRNAQSFTDVAAPLRSCPPVQELGRQTRRDDVVTTRLLPLACRHSAAPVFVHQPLALPAARAVCRQSGRQAELDRPGPPLASQVRAPPVHVSLPRPTSGQIARPPSPRGGVGGGVCTGSRPPGRAPACLPPPSSPFPPAYRHACPRRPLLSLTPTRSPPKRQ